RPAARAEAIAQLGEEARVDEDRLVGGAVERPDRARGRTARRAQLTGEELDLTTALAALERTGPVVVEDRRRALHAAVEVGVGVGPRVALLERRLLTLRGAALEPADEPRQVGPAEQRHHERDEPHDADASAHRDAA